MRKNLFFIFLITFLLFCGGPKLDDQAIKPPTTNEEAIKIYQEGLDGMLEGNFLYASRKFSEAEGMLPQIDWASKSALMSSYCLYNINFYQELMFEIRKHIKNGTFDDFYNKYIHIL